MKRKTLTMLNENGVREDLIPNVDALAVSINGSNLKETIESINSQLKANSLFKGAYGSENELLAVYPNGTELEQGTYAIVTDDDAIYLYDVETLTWKRTATSGLAISQINGLTGTNGSLTLTGGDIIANVPNADIDEQSITNHLDTLYDKANDAYTISYGTVAMSYSFKPTTKDDNNVIFNPIVQNAYKNSNLLYMTLKTPSSISTEETSKNLKININYADETTKSFVLYSADQSTITYKDLQNHFGISSSGNSEIDVLIKTYDGIAVLLNFYKKNYLKNTISLNITLAQNNWVDNEEGTGFKYVITAPESTDNNSYVVLAVYKLNNNIKTTAIVDYATNKNIITIYSDEKFTGGVTIQYSI